MNINNGEIWLSKSVPVLPDETNLYNIENPYYVYILNINKSKGYKDFKTVLIIPISFEIENASILDLIVEKQNIFNKKFMIEVWNSQSMLVNNLDKKIHSFNNEFHKDVCRLFDYKNDKSIFVGDINTGHPESGQYKSVNMFQETEIKRTEYLRVPALLLNKIIEQNGFSEKNYVQFIIRIKDAELLEYSRCSNIRSHPPLIVCQGCKPVLHLLKPANRFVLGVRRGTYSINKTIYLVKEVEDLSFKVILKNTGGKINILYQVFKNRELLKDAVIKVFKDTNKFDELLLNSENISFENLFEEGHYKIQVHYDSKLIAEDYFKVEYENKR